MSVFEASRLAGAIERLEGGAARLNNATALRIGGVDDAWETLTVRSLPLFNGQSAKSVYVEDLTQLAQRCVDRIDSKAPDHALVYLRKLGFVRRTDRTEQHVSDLFEKGSLTLKARVERELGGTQPESVLSALLTSFGVLHSFAVPHLQAALLPISRRGVSIRVIALAAFRDRVMLPYAGSLGESLRRSGGRARRSSGPATSAKTTQMLGLIASVQSGDTRQSTIDDLLALHLKNAAVSRRASRDASNALEPEDTSEGEAGWK